MSEPLTAPGQAGDARDLTAHVAAIRTQVRRDLRATSFPLLLLGAATVAGVVTDLATGRPDNMFPGGDWLTGVLMTAAFIAMWLVYRRRAIRGGVGRPTGFGAAAVLALCLTMTVGLIAIFLTGPFLVFGLGLLVAGIWQRNRFLIWWALLAGGTGVFEGFFGFTNRMPAMLWHSWDHQAIYLVIGVLTVLAGLAARWRENHAR